MAMVGVDSGSLYRRTYSLSRLTWSWVGGRLAPFYIYQMNQVYMNMDMVQQWHRCRIAIDHGHHFSIRTFGSNSLLAI